MCGANLEAPVGRNRDSSRQSLAKLNYLEIKQIMDRWSTQQKKGKLTDAEIKGLVNEWHDQRREGDLNKAMADREMKSMEAKLEKYNVDQLGEIPIEREDGTMRIMVCQMG
jgi:peroxiredoxin family protein